MMNHNLFFQNVLPDDLSKLIENDEFLFILPGHGKENTLFSKFHEKTVPSLRRDEDYASFHFGFLKSDFCAPFALLEWRSDGKERWQPSLEKRFLARKLIERVKVQFNLKKASVFLGEHALDLVHLSIAEDVYTSYADPAYHHSGFKSFRILTPHPDDIQRIDPWHKVRFERQLAFRSWVNENPDSLTSIEIGERLKAFAQKHHLPFESFHEEELSQLGMNLLLAVGQASSRSPSRLHIVSSNLNTQKPPLLLIGKGITFDTGGINLKPHESFVNCMKNDMAGAGLMAQMFMALVESGYDGPIVLAIPACENLIAERSFKPGAIIKSYAGKEVIIEHTDAEGRLILADALHYTQKRYKPAYTLMAATLTTAALRQFSNWFTPVHFAKPALRHEIEAAGLAFGEGFSFWDHFLPFRDGNKTQAADLTNMGRMPSHANIGGGSNVAAHFLKEFALSPVAHFDIFASTWNWSGDYPGAHYGATGAPFNSLFRALRMPQMSDWIAL